MPNGLSEPEVPSSTPVVSVLDPSARWFLGLLVAVALWTAGSRHLSPQGDGFPLMPPGASDFHFPFNGARALLLGVDPYDHDVPGLLDPWRRDLVVADGVRWRNYYPPSYFLLGLPFVVLTGADWERSTRILHVLSLAALAGLAAAAVALARRLEVLPTGDASLLVGGVLLLSLAASPATALLLDRGQLDALLALCTWVGTALFLARRGGPSALLLSVAVLAKGYAALASGGVLALALLDRRTRRGAALGTLAAGVVLLLPVLRWFPEGIHVTRIRSSVKMIPAWFCHSFRALGGSLHPALADVAPGLVVVVGIAGAALCFRRAVQAGPGREAERTLWVVLLTTCGLAGPLGLANVSCTYNLLHVMPGVAVLGLSQARLAELTRVPPRALQALLCVSALCLWVARTWSPTFPLAAVGLVLVVALGAACGLTARREDTPG